MTMNNMPGFTAEISLYKRSGRYQSVATQVYSSAEKGVISQMRGGGAFGFSIGRGQMGLEGFWGCFACVAACTVFTKDALACYSACQGAGAC